MNEKIEKTFKPFPNVFINIHINIHTQGENTEANPSVDMQSSLRNSIDSIRESRKHTKVISGKYLPIEDYIKEAEK